MSKTEESGLVEMRHFKNFLAFVKDFDENDPKTWKDIAPTTITMEEVFKKFGLDPSTRDFVGHVLALYSDDDYLQKPCLNTVMRIKLYSDSVVKSAPTKTTLTLAIKAAAKAAPPSPSTARAAPSSAAGAVAPSTAGQLLPPPP